MQKLLTGALAFYFISPCEPLYAQPQPAPADTSAFCQSGSVAAATGGGNKVVTEAIWQKCRRGDVIQIPAGSTFVVSTVCDFTRSIVVSGGQVICVLLAKERPNR